MNIIETYPTILNSKGNQIDGLYMLTVELRNIGSDGELISMSIGNMINATSSAISFVIDENIYNQLENLRIKLIDNKFQLVAREGYEFKTIEEQETPEQKKIRELKEQLAALESQEDEGE